MALSSPVEKKMADDAEAMVSEARPFTYGENGLPPPPAYTAEEERRLWRKIDMRIIPIATLMYLVSYLDRGNIGTSISINDNTEFRFTKRHTGRQRKAAGAAHSARSQRREV